MNEVKISKMGTISLLMIASLTIMVGTVVAPGLLSISKELGVENYATWLITIPSLGVVIFSFFLVKIVKKLGYYNALKMGLLAYGFFGISGMFLEGIVPVFLDRFLLGGATGIVLVSVNGLITHFYHGQQRVKIMALQVISVESGGVLILGLSGILAVISWEYPFYIYLFAWLFFIMLCLFIPNPNISLETNSIENSVEIKNSIKSILSMVLFSMFLFFTVIIILPLYLLDFGFTEDHIGYLLAFISAMAIVAAGTTPKLSKTLQSRTILTIAFMAYSIGHLIFFSFTETFYFILGSFFFGVGFGLAMPTLNHIVIEKSIPINLTKNLTLFTMLIFLGQFLASFNTFLPGNTSFIFLLATLFSLFLVFCLQVLKFGKGAL